MYKIFYKPSTQFPVLDGPGIGPTNEDPRKIVTVEDFVDFANMVLEQGKELGRQEAQVVTCFHNLPKGGA